MEDRHGVALDNERTDPIGHRGRDLICARAGTDHEIVDSRPSGSDSKRLRKRDREAGGRQGEGDWKQLGAENKGERRGGRLQITASTLLACLRDQSLKLETIMSICHSDDARGHSHALPET